MSSERTRGSRGIEKATVKGGGESEETGDLGVGQVGIGSQREALNEIR